jgi:hypothetical protein
MSSKHQVQSDSSTSDGWKITRATVTSCRRSFLSGGRVYDTGGPATPTTYIVTFEYEVNSKRYIGKMRSDTTLELGHHFQISYNPKSPSRNTGSDYQLTGFRVIAWAIGAAIAGAILYFQYR